jgi:cytochrome c peroxidase
MSRPVVSALLFGAALSVSPAADAQEDPAEVTLGERLFLETRFAEFFARNATDVNLPLAAGDPVVAATVTTGAPLPGPFAGSSINCRACHFVDEHVATPGGGMRTYADFARRSPVSAREDGHLTTVRNSPPLVNASLERANGLLLHFDGEFAALEDLVLATLTGRNYGWLPDESQLAIAHIARVIREDDGTGALAQTAGGSYARVLKGTDPTLPDEFRLRELFRVDVERVSDAKIVDAVARLIAAYVRSLEFETDESGAFVGSPFDRFLEVNALPRFLRDAETAENFSKRLRGSLKKLRNPQFVADGPFALHPQQRNFGAAELAGLRVFLAEPPKQGVGPTELLRGGIGNCVACHPAPLFTDFRVHNTGVSQLEYDEVHGDGSFLALAVPDLATRSLDPEEWLPATPQHPNAREPFRAIPTEADPQHVDLGVWNLFANPDFPEPQARLSRTLCFKLKPRRGCAPELLLARALAAFKTPGLRDLSHSAPYLHDGGSDTLEDVVRFYRRASDLARAGELRNGAAPMAGIALSSEDVAPLAAFLRSLNEDYQ